MKILAADYIAECQLKWAAQMEIPCEGSYTKKVEDNIFNHELHPQDRLYNGLFLGLNSFNSSHFQDSTDAVSLP